MAFNYGLLLVEVVAILIVLFLVISLINKLLPKDQRILTNAGSLALSLLIVFGIIFGIGFVIESLEYYYTIIGYLNNNYLFFAIAICIYFPLYKAFLKKFDKSRPFEDIDLRKIFKKIYIIMVGLVWGIALIFLSFDILGIQLVWEPNKPDYDMLYIGVFTAFFTVFFITILTYLINKAKPVEKQTPKVEFKNSLIASGIISFGIWFVQFIVIEMYISRLFGITIIKQDLRVIMVVVLGIFIVSYFNLLRIKFLPEAVIKSKKKFLEAIIKEKEKPIQKQQFREKEAIVDAQDFDVSFNEHENDVYLVESVSCKFYLYLLKKLRNLHLLDDSIHLKEKNRRMIKIIIVGLLWIITFVIVLINLIQLLSTLNPIFDMFVLSVKWAFFMVLIDISINIILNKLIPTENRITKKFLRDSIFIGGIILLWIWVVPLFFIYYYFFMGIYQIIISDLFSTIISLIIIFIIGIYITRWLSSKKGFDASLRKAVIMNLLWFIINLPLKLFFVYVFGDNLLNNVLILVIDITIGSVIVMKLYSKEFKQSLIFAFNIEVITFFLSIIIIDILLNLFLIILPNYNFNVQDIRVHLIVDITIFLIFYAISLKVKFYPEHFKKEMRQGQVILPAVTETQIQDKRIEGKKIILDVNDLTTYFYSEEGVVRAVEGVSFKIYEGETLGLVGETGCGKSVTALSILQVVRPPGKIESGKVIFDGEDLLQKSEKEILNYRGNKITMIFQDPLNSLNPVFKVGRQISEVFLLHMEDELLLEATKHPGKSIYSIARELSEQLLRELNIPSPERIYDLYPHELSGGMRQRIQVAMALACSPRLLIADEPTTALDVTIQNQILHLMKILGQKYNTSILFITHDLGIISKMCDRVAVMYSGFIVEYGDVYRIFERPSHPYTKGLIASIPVVGKKKEELEVIPGLVPNLIYPPSGCRFHPRCQYRFEPCNSKVPKSIEVEPEYFVACHLYDPQYKN